MRDLALRTTSIPAMAPEAIDRVRATRDEEAALPQIVLDYQHLLHREAGLYLRTLRLPPAVKMTGALIKIATAVIVQGDCWVWLGDKSRHLTGYNVLPASAGRMQAFWSVEETFITMIFPTTARDVESAEREFTDEFEALGSRRSDTPNQIVIAGE